MQSAIIVWDALDVEYYVATPPRRHCAHAEL